MSNEPNQKKQKLDGGTGDGESREATPQRNWREVSSHDGDWKIELYVEDEKNINEAKATSTKVKDACKSIAKEYLVHKSVLSEGERKCGYFEGLFGQGDFVEFKSQTSVFELPQFAIDQFDSFLDYIYSTRAQWRFDISRNNAFALAYLADRFDNPTLKKAVFEALRNNYDPHRTLSMLKLSHGIIRENEIACGCLINVNTAVPLAHLAEELDCPQLKDLVREFLLRDMNMDGPFDTDWLKNRKSSFRSLLHNAYKLKCGGIIEWLSRWAATLFTHPYSDTDAKPDIKDFWPPCCDSSDFWYKVVVSMGEMGCDFACSPEHALFAYNVAARCKALTKNQFKFLTSRKRIPDFDELGEIRDHSQVDSFDDFNYFDAVMLLKAKKGCAGQ